MSISNKDYHLLQPDGYSYILYSEENNTTYHKPLATPLQLKHSQFVVKCRPTYVDHLTQNNITIEATNSDEFLAQLNTPKLKDLTPSILDSIIFHLHFLNENTSLKQLSKRYQCDTKNIENLFKRSVGLSFIQYQNILITLRRPTY